jgi:hypothetical protein
MKVENAIAGRGEGGTVKQRKPGEEKSEFGLFRLLLQVHIHHIFIAMVAFISGQNFRHPYK